MKINLTGNAEKTLAKIAALTGEDTGTVIKRMLGRELLLVEHQVRGGVVLLKDRTGLQQLHIR